MLNWLRGLINRVSGAERQLWNDIINVIMAVDGYLEGWLQQSLNIGQTAISDVRTVLGYLNSFIGNSYNPFVRWVQQQLFNITVREHQDYSQIGADIAQLQAHTNQQITVVQQSVSDGISGLIKWIIQHIFDPLFGDVSKALSWIANEGAFILDLITHADKLILYLLHFLGGEWKLLVDKYGKIVLRWFISGFKLLAPEFIALLEDIITSVL